MLDRDRLRMARLRLRLSQETLGRAIGQDQSYVSKLERGDLLDITINTLERLADVLRVSTDYLLRREEIESEAEPAAVALVSA
jgi:transcriptional regulator with XRE-family HTH domain